ncbi:hypothetical protein Sgleb_00990 [Streptomyces glebosus]|uniref:Bacterial Ig-like domain-containing protein n=1 Tax=Streptomyces glebosus TaxID=249580 RepID=A0A640SMS0_9ACTN|nr:Ig-like domain-containing protein [Streptomyces glebosus]GFE12052.1 hypothetical protein Sgleb_00990 [Streptomyces glebosus]GHG74137.1 hypothetical protein GCM10010513_47860 [Streptomyces glebosus]
MLTPERACGLALTDRDGNYIAVIDPLSHRVVPTLSAPAPHMARCDAGGPVVCTVVDGTDLAAPRDSATLLGALSALRNTSVHGASWRRFAAAAHPGLMAARNQFSGVFPDQGSTGGGTLVTIIGRSAPVSTPLTAGTATTGHVYTAAAANPYTVTATYDGDADFTTSVGTDTQSVQPAGTALAVVSAPDPSTVGELVTFSATVTALAPGAGTPTGTVTFDFGDGTPTVTATAVGGTVTVTHAYTTTAGSPYTVSATYSGNADFSPATGTGSQSLYPAATTMEVTSGPDPAVVGQPVTVTATVAPAPPGAGTPTGTVTVAFGDATPPATAPLIGGAVTLMHTYTSSLSSPYTITATYNSSSDFTGSVATATQTVLPDATTTAGTPTGTVTFSFGDGTSTATATLSGGVATVTHPYTTTTGSPFTLTATYGGDASFNGSTGTDTQTVTRATTSTTVISTPNPSTTGDRVTVTATVVPVAPGTGTPTGTVTLAITGRSPQAVPLVNGTASASFNPLPRGTHLVTGNYNGDVSFAPSSGTTLQTVN